MPIVLLLLNLLSTKSNEHASRKSSNVRLQYDNSSSCHCRIRLSWICRISKCIEYVSTIWNGITEHRAMPSRFNSTDQVSYFEWSSSTCWSSKRGIFFCSLNSCLLIRLNTIKIQRHNFDLGMVLKVVVRYSMVIHSNTSSYFLGSLRRYKQLDFSKYWQFVVDDFSHCQMRKTKNVWIFILL